MGEEDPSQLLGENVAPETVRGHRRVDGMRTEVHLFFGDSVFHGNLVDDVFLSSVLNTNVAEAEMHFLVHEHTLGVDSTVHDVDLGDDTDGTDTFGIELASHLKAIGGSHILVCRHHTKDNSARVLHIPAAHSFRNLLDVSLLRLKCDPGNTR